LAQASSNLASSTVSITNNGSVGGGQLGYNFYQVAWFGTSFVAGVEADLEGVSGKDSASVATTVPVTGFPNHLNQTASVSTNIDYLATLRGRFGVLVSFLETTVLYYVTGGLAYGGVTASTTVTQSVAGPNGLFGLTPPTWTGTGHFSGTRFGLAAGVGAEWPFFTNWSAH
jgi:outer membrane immunogenic protein